MAFIVRLRNYTDDGRRIPARIRCKCGREFDLESPVTKCECSRAYDAQGREIAERDGEKLNEQKGE